MGPRDVVGIWVNDLGQPLVLNNIGLARIEY